MTLYRTSFERTNFSFTPPLEQKADVVFEFDGDIDDLELHIDAAYEACYEQNPQWRDPSSPIKGFGGWSSVLWDHNIVEAELRILK